MDLITRVGAKGKIYIPGEAFNKDEETSRMKLMVDSWKFSVVLVPVYLGFWWWWLLWGADFSEFLILGHPPGQSIGQSIDAADELVEIRRNDLLHHDCEVFRRHLQTVFILRIH